MRNVSGTYTFTENTNIRTAPSLSAPVVGTYYPGDSVTYTGQVNAEGYICRLWQYALRCNEWHLSTIQYQQYFGYFYLYSTNQHSNCTINVNSWGLLPR
ncbi:SH3 domain-containing protein [Lactiplantibacillus plantarum]|uniref:SH3 domain-containing protein n=1 Tax=Lactiplantibacillus plantarum TaxID=1590 RepID=UPI0019107562